MYGYGCGVARLGFSVRAVVGVSADVYVDLVTSFLERSPTTNAHNLLTVARSTPVQSEKKRAGDFTLIVLERGFGFAGQKCPRVHATIGVQMFFFLQFRC